MKNAVIRVEAVTYDYPTLRALDDVSFEIEQGSITALVGPNGAGKSTLMRCMAGLDQPLEGRIELAGIDVFREARAAHEKMGYLPDFFGLYDDLSIQHCLQYRAAAQAVPRADIPGRVRQAAERLEIADRLHQKAGELSRGLRQRLAIAQAIIHKPAVLILDEPASGLDPEARIDLSNLLLKLRDEGMTLMVSSHILAELQDYSTHMMIIDGGKLVEYSAVGESAAAGGASGEVVRIVLAAPSNELAPLLNAADGVQVQSITEDREAFVVMGSDPTARAALLTLLASKGLSVASFGPAQQRLQDAYIARVRAAREQPMTHLREEPEDV